jgi:hypothetical protein
VLVPATRRNQPEYNLSANSKRSAFVEIAGLTQKRQARQNTHWWISATAVVDFSLTARRDLHAQRNARLAIHPRRRLN